MAIRLIMMPLTLGLAWKACVAKIGLRLAAVEVDDENAMLDACARASVLVLLSLLGLLALGIMYGNVLGVNTTP